VDLREIPLDGKRVIHIVSFLYCICEKALWGGKKNHEKATVMGLKFT